MMQIRRRYSTNKSLESSLGSASRFFAILRPMLLGLMVVSLLLLTEGPLKAQELADSLPQVEADTVLPVVRLPDIQVYADRRRLRPMTEEERKAYWRRVRDVKKTLPYAKYVARTIIETYEYCETLETEKERRAHWRRVERELKEEMEPKMHKLTLNQGKLLIKLVNRQTGQTGYALTKAFLGGWKAFWWNGFAKLLGANLNTPYDPVNNGDDRLTERIALLVEAKML